MQLSSLAAADHQHWTCCRIASLTLTSATREHIAHIHTPVIFGATARQHWNLYKRTSLTLPSVIGGKGAHTRKPAISMAAARQNWSLCRCKSSSIPRVICENRAQIHRPAILAYAAHGAEVLLFTLSLELGTNPRSTRSFARGNMFAAHPIPGLVGASSHSLADKQLR